MKREFKLKNQQGAPQVATKKLFLAQLKHREVYKKTNRWPKVNLLYLIWNLVLRSDPETAEIKPGPDLWRES